MAKAVGMGAENAEGAPWKQLVDKRVVEGRKKHMGIGEATLIYGRGTLKSVNELISGGLTCFRWLPDTPGINQVTVYLYTLVHALLYPLQWEIHWFISQDSVVLVLWLIKYIRLSKYTRWTGTSLSLNVCVYIKIIPHGQSVRITDIIVQVFQRLCCECIECHVVVKRRCILSAVGSSIIRVGEHTRCGWHHFQTVYHLIQDSPR